MVYQTRWDSSRPEASIKEAEKRAGYSPIGFLYRFENQSYSQSSGWDDDVYYTVTYIELEAHPILNKTPKGWTILADNGLGWRFVSQTSRKRFAHRTVVGAFKGFIARKEAQARIYQGLADKATKLRDDAVRYLTILEEDHDNGNIFGS